MIKLGAWRKAKTELPPGTCPECGGEGQVPVDPRCSCGDCSTSVTVKTCGFCLGSGRMSPACVPMFGCGGQGVVWDSSDSGSGRQCYCQCAAGYELWKKEAEGR